MPTGHLIATRHALAEAEISACSAAETLQADRVSAEVDAIKGQVEQARKILADAIAKLGESFGTLDHETSEQKTLIHSVLMLLSDSVPEDAGRQNDPARSLNARAFARETTDVLHHFTDLLASVSAQSIKTVYRIDDMAEQLDGVFKLIANINEISEETFILAVNATIEAAHAGQAGRAFAVIASNVRELSKKTRRFNEEIGTQISRAQGTVKEARRIIADMASRDLNAALDGKERVQQMLAELERVQAVIAGSVQSANTSAGRISDATSHAVTALQFEDIMAQLIGAIERRAERLESLAGRGSRGGGASDGQNGWAALPGPSDPHRQIVRTISDPVRQQNMNAGDVELF